MLKQLVEVFGPARMLFGTDYPAVPISPAEHIGLVESLELSRDEKEAILSRNALDLFKLERRWASTSRRARGDERDAFGTVLVPAALMLLMLALGLSLEVGDFRRVLGCPRALAGGLVGQLVLLPVFGALVATVSGLDATFATGILILSLSPGGALSKLFLAVVAVIVS